MEHSQVTQPLETWVTQAKHLGLIINGTFMHTMWKRISGLFTIPHEYQLNCSKGWLTSFKNQTGLQEIKRHGEAGL